MVAVVVIVTKGAEFEMGVDPVVRDLHESAALDVPGEQCGDVKGVTANRIEEPLDPREESAVRTRVSQIAAEFIEVGGVEFFDVFAGFGNPEMLEESFNEARFGGTSELDRGRFPEPGCLREGSAYGFRERGKYGPPVSMSVPSMSRRRSFREAIGDGGKFYQVERGGLIQEALGSFFFAGAFFFLEAGMDDMLGSIPGSVSASASASVLASRSASPSSRSSSSSKSS